MVSGSVGICASYTKIAVCAAGNNLDLSKTYPGTSLSRSASYSYLQLAAESVGSASTSGSRGIPMVSSWHNIHERSKGSADYSSYADSDGN